MARPNRAAGWTRWLPYALTAVGLVAGLLVVLFRPLPDTTLNYVVASVCFGVAVASVVGMIVAHSGPGERGPDF